MSKNKNLQIAKELEKFNFDNFDGDSFDPDMFDPDMFDAGDDDYSYADGGKPKFALRGMAQVDIFIDNTQQASAQQVELFNYLRSAVFIRNTTLDATKIPFTLDGISAVATNANFPNQTIFFDQSGNLIMRGASASSYCKISCGQLPYRSLFEASSRSSFMLSKMRLSVSNATQIDQSIVHFKNTMFGGIQENSISPRSFFSPTQQQSLIIDIPNLKLILDQERGLRVNVLANQSLNISLFINEFRKLGNV